mmetsp:Transcript_107318/g.313814  ORF Transcript_107318/g.313814 Transcript_107318/m.313814 type:complete len:746 (-) Transcript_107318:275-2512(-)
MRLFHYLRKPLMHVRRQVQALALNDLNDDLRGREACEGRLAHDSLPVQDPCRVDVRHRRESSHLSHREELRRHVRDRAQLRRHDVHGVSLQHPGQAEVADLADVALPGHLCLEQHVVRSQVPVDDAARMEVGAGARNVQPDVHHLGHGALVSARPAAVRAQRAAVAPLLHHPRLQHLVRLVFDFRSRRLVPRAGHEGLHQVRVRHARREHRLEGRLELPLLLLVPRLDGLHRHGRAHPEAVEDLPKGPLANYPQEPHVVEGRAGRLDGRHSIQGVAPALLPRVAALAALPGVVQPPGRRRRVLRGIWTRLLPRKLRSPFGRLDSGDKVETTRNVPNHGRSATSFALWHRANGRGCGVQRELRRHEAARNLTPLPGAGHALHDLQDGPLQRKGDRLGLRPLELDLFSKLVRILPQDLQPAQEAQLLALPLPAERHLASRTVRSNDLLGQGLARKAVRRHHAHARELRPDLVDPHDRPVEGSLTDLDQAHRLLQGLLHALRPQRARGEVGVGRDRVEHQLLVVFQRQLLALDLLRADLAEVHHELGLQRADRSRDRVYGAQGAQAKAVGRHQGAASVEADEGSADDQRVVADPRVALRVADERHHGAGRRLRREREGAEAGVPRRGVVLQAHPRLEPLVLVANQRDQGSGHVHERRDDPRDGIIVLLVLVGVHDAKAIQAVIPAFLVGGHGGANVDVLHSLAKGRQLEEGRLALQSPAHVHLCRCHEELRAITEEVEHLREESAIPV